MQGCGEEEAMFCPQCGAQAQYQRESAQSAEAQAGAQAFFSAGLYHRRFTVERTFAWKDKFKRLLLRFETKPIHHLGFKLLAFTLINLREFCGG
jgi:transposase